MKGRFSWSSLKPVQSKAIMDHSNILVSGSRGRLGQSIIQLAPDAKIATRYTAEKGLLDPNEIQIGLLGSAAAEQLSGIDTIVNCAGRAVGSPDELHQANVVFPVNLATSAKKAGVKRFIQASSFSVFGEKEKIGRNLTENAKTEYGKSKLESENSLIALADKDFCVICLRFPHIFEPKKINKLIKLAKMIKYTRVFPYFSDTYKVERSMITYGQAARAMLLTTRGFQSGKYIVADIETFNIIKFIKMMEEHNNILIYKFLLPDFFKSLLTAISPEVFRSIYTSSFCDKNDIDLIYQENLNDELLKELNTALYII